MSDTKLTEQESPESSADNSLYHELLNTIYDAVILTDTAGAIVEINARAKRNLQFSREQFLEMNIVDIISNMGELLENLKKEITSRKSAFIETTCLRSDGTAFNAEVVINKLMGYEQKVLCFFIRDTTLRKEASEQLLHTEKTKARTDTISTLLHEFNNPLQILMSLPDTEENKEYKDQVNRIIEVLNELQEDKPLEVVLTEEGEECYDLPTNQPINEPRGPLDLERILVVDDEDILRQVFSTGISSGHPELIIDQAGNGADAVDIFTQNKHCLIIMDIFMPIMDGEDAFKEIQKICEESNIKLPSFIFCTGFNPSNFCYEIIDDGTYHKFLKKPFQMSELINVVSELLAQQRAD